MYFKLDIHAGRTSVMGEGKPPHGERFACFVCTSLTLET